MDNVTELPIPARLVRLALKHIEFVRKQVSRFKRMSFREFESYTRGNPSASLCSIPHPDGKGHFYCGHLAWDRLGLLADLAIELDEIVGRRVSRQLAMDATVKTFSKRILLMEVDINQEMAGLMLREVLSVMKESLIATEHYLPCVLFPRGGPDEFSIGPVTFIRRNKFFKDRKAAFRSSIEAGTASHIRYVDKQVEKGYLRERLFGEHESRQLVRRLQARAIRAYRAYPWIACVKVSECDEHTSRHKGARAVEMAIHVIRIILGGENTRKIRLAWSQSPVLRTAHLQSDSLGVISASTSVNSMGPVGADNWHEGMMRCTWELEMLGTSLYAIVDPRVISHLHHRLLDAINWFGDAAMDTNRSSSIVKYVSSIERLLFGSFEQGRKKSFAKRVSSVLKAFDCDDNGTVHQQALMVYELRSALVHGQYRETAKEVGETANLSRMCLLCSLQLYLLMKQVFGNPDPTKLEEVMKRLVEDGIDWLLKAAGNPEAGAIG